MKKLSNAQTNQHFALVTGHLGTKILSKTNYLVDVGKLECVRMFNR